MMITLNVTILINESKTNAKEKWNFSNHHNLLIIIRSIYMAKFKLWVEDIFKFSKVEKERSRINQNFCHAVMFFKPVSED